MPDPVDMLFSFLLIGFFRSLAHRFEPQFMHDFQNMLFAYNDALGLHCHFDSVRTVSLAAAIKYLLNYAHQLLFFFIP